MWCWWCCHPFEGTALSMPHKHDERRNKFYTSGEVLLASKANDNYKLNKILDSL